MPDKFIELIRKLKQGDENAVLLIRRNIETIVLHHFSKKNIELEWVAKQDGISGYTEIFDELLVELTEKIKEEENAFNSFVEYKEFILGKSEVVIQPFFDNFYQLLLQNDRKAWNSFDKLIKIRITSWLLKKGYNDFEFIDTVYQEAQSVFLENLKKKQLSFENSGKLKSYLFKVVHLKLLEYQREQKKKEQSITIDEKINDASNFNTFLSDIDKEELMQKLFRNLNDLEKGILTETFFYENKMKDIAGRYKITESNCRVIKHRALGKLEGIAKQLGYG